MSTRVRLIINLRQVLEIKMRVDLSRRDAGVTEHLLHGTQIAGALQHMGRKGMTQLVGVNALRQALALAMLLQTQLDHTGRNAFALLPDKQCGLVGLGQLRADSQPGLDGD